MNMHFDYVPGKIVFFLEYLLSECIKPLSPLGEKLQRESIFLNRFNLTTSTSYHLVTQ